jgi:hypothetical protein
MQVATLKIDIKNSVENFLEKMVGDHSFMNKLALRDEAMFHQSGRVNRRILRVWGSEKPLELFER